MREIKRLFLVSVLAVTFAVLGATVAPSASSAEDVWVYSNGAVSFYLVTDSIKVNRGNRPPYTHKKWPPYSCSITKVYEHNGSFCNVEFLGFANEDGVIVGFGYSRTNGTWSYWGKVSDDPYLSAVWSAMESYI